MGALEPGHLLILLIALFVVVGPSRLPEVGRAAGEALKEFRRATDELRVAALTDDPASARPAATPVDRRDEAAPGGVDGQGA